MSGAQSWSVKGIDPKVREAAREAAARQGMSLGEYLSLALQSHQGPPGSAPMEGAGVGATPSFTQPGYTRANAQQQPQSAATTRFRSQRFGQQPQFEEEEEDWSPSGSTHLPRVTDPVRLAQRIESIERRTQLAVTGLDRAVSTIDRSVLGLAARIEDAEALSGESADRIADAIEQFRQAGDTLSGRLEHAEEEVSESRDLLDRARSELAETRERLTTQVASTQAELRSELAETRDRLTSHVTGAQGDFSSVRERLEHQVEAAGEIARRAEAAASFLATELENRDAALGHKLGAFEDRTRDAIGTALTHARVAAEEAARQAAEASADAVLELRTLQDRLADRLEESEHGARRAIETAIEETRTHNQRLVERVAGVEFEARGAKESLVEEVVRLESEIGARIASAEQLKAEQHALIVRIEKAEAGSREATAGLRQAAGAAIADLRNAQLGLAARLKQVEEAAGRAGALDLAEMRAHQAEIGERLIALEDKVQASPMQEALANFEKRLEEIAQRAKESDPNLAHVERRLDDLAMRVEHQPSIAPEKLEEVGGAVKTLDEALNRLTARLAETETSANTAIRSLEETVSNLGARVESAGTTQETEKLRALLESRLDDMAQSVAHMVGEARTEIAGQVEAALGGNETEGLEGALLDVNRRLAAAERRQAQTIEAISIEIKRMSESVDKRLRTVEARNDDAAGSAVREELSRMGRALEARFDEIERREAAAFDRMGLEVGRLSERLEERVGAVEGRSAQAIEHVGEQVARMAERFNQRHEHLARDLGERMLDSEERAGARVTDAIGSIMQRLSEVEEHSTEAVAPVKKAVSSVASRLEALEIGKHDLDEDEDDHQNIPTPSRRFEDFGTLEHVAPIDAAQPVRAAPLPPVTAAPPAAPTPPPSLVEPEHDIYFAEDVDDFTATPAPTPVHAEAPAPSPHTPLGHTTLTHTPLDLSFDDSDVVMDDVFLKDADAFAPPPPEDDDPFWTPEALAPTTPPTAATATHIASQHDEAPTPAAAPGKNDYLSAARKAAQAQTTNTKTRKDTPKQQEAERAPTYSLRGSSRIVLWGAASAISLLIAGGAWYLHAQSEAQRAPAPAPTPAAVPETTPQPAAEGTEQTTGAYDPNAPFGQPASTDPFAQPNGDASGATPADQAAPAAATPQTAAPTTAAGATAARATPAPALRTMAGPLPLRTVSLEQAAHGGDPVAQYELALQRIAANHGGEAVLMLHSAADHGLAMAQYRLAKLYERGEGVPVDLTLARQWTERAAAAGNKRAMHDLGVYFARGEGAPLDEAAAFRWFRQAAELGVADSQFNLGVLYQQGRGVGASPSEAEFWFLVAARQGDEDAAARAHTLESQLPPIQVDQARARAEAFRPRASSAVANGEFGPRPWTATTVSPAVAPATTPTTATRAAPTRPATTRRARPAA